jgi:putative ABC transport system substrate-binding protein
MMRRPIGLLVTLALSLLVAPLAADVQPPAHVHRIGAITGTTREQDRNVAAFLEGMRALGYVEGQNLVLEYRGAAGQYERFPALAAELVRIKVDVLLVGPTPAALAAKDATTTLPIVMAGVGDPVGSGLVASLARPGGNITGVSVLRPEVVGKQLEFLKAALPTVSAWPSSGIPPIPPTPSWCGRRTWRPRRWASSCTAWRRAVPTRLTAPSRP